MLLFLHPKYILAQEIEIDGKVVVSDVLDERLLIKASAIPNYRQEIRDIIQTLSSYTKELNPNFIFAIKGGEELFFKTEWEKKLSELQIAEENNDITEEEIFLRNMFNPPPPQAPVGSEKKDYLKSIDGWITIDLNCANRLLPAKTTQTLQDYNIPIFSAENCQNFQEQTDYPSNYFFAKKVSTTPPNHNTIDNIYSLDQAKNISFIIDNSQYNSKAQELKDIRNNNYDIIVINPFFRKNIVFSKQEIEQMKIKKIGGKRLILAYFNMSVINDEMYFWKRDWKLSHPIWIRLLSPFSKEDYVVEYWAKEWHNIINEYTQSVMRLGFDGILIDGLDYHFLFEKLTQI